MSLFYRFLPWPLSAVLLILGLHTGAARAEVFVVNQPGVGTTNGCNASCTFRDALEDALSNGASSIDTINFDIPGAGPHDICGPNGAVAVNTAVLINGLTQDGARANASQTGFDANLLIACRFLVIEHPNVLVKGILLQGLSLERGNGPSAPSPDNFRLHASLVSGTANGVAIKVQEAVNARIGDGSISNRNLIEASVLGIKLPPDVPPQRSSSVTVRGNVFRNNETHISVEEVGQVLVVGGTADGDQNVFSDSRREAVRCHNESSCIIRQSEVRRSRNGGAGFSGLVTGAGNIALLQSAQQVAGGVQVRGLIARSANDIPQAKIFDLDVFANVGCNNSGRGDGESLLGSIAFTSPTPQQNEFVALIPFPALPSDVLITATATERGGLNTSNFSTCVLLEGLPGGDALFRDSFD